MLADRGQKGAVAGRLLINGKRRSPAFQREIGYVQQADVHLHTATVREALQFSALLRQPASVPREEKLDHVEEIIHSLEMESYADAVIGLPGNGKAPDSTRLNCFLK